MAWLVLVLRIPMLARVWASLCREEDGEGNQAGLAWLAAAVAVRFEWNVVCEITALFKLLISQLCNERY